MNMKQGMILLVCTAFLTLSGGTAFSADARDMMTGHAFYGIMNIPNDDSDLEGDDFEIDIFGADAQKPLGGDAFRYGYEGGMLFSIDSDTRSMGASSGSGGGTVVVAVDVNSIMIDGFVGGYISIEPSKHFRLYAGAGPLLIWAKRETEPEESAPDYLKSESESDFGAGLYARTGLDLFLTDQFGLFAGARINTTTLGFEDSTGTIDIEGCQYYFGLAFRF